MDEILKLIFEADDLDEYSFGGNCFSMALALHEFIPNSQIIAAVNKHLYTQTKKIRGHCAVRVNDLLIDGHGKIEEEDFLSWGMLDPEDLSSIDGTSINPKIWPKLSSDAIIIELRKEDLENYADQEVIAKILSILRK